MAHYLIKQLYAEMPKADIAGVKVSGWVRTKRESKTIAFVALNDGTYFKPLQLILEPERLPDYAELVKRIRNHWITASSRHSSCLLSAMHFHRHYSWL